MTQVILIMTYGRNLYDHSMDIEHEVRYESATNSEERLHSYILHAQRTIAHPRMAWLAINELNVTTGENKQIFYEAKPLQQRLEVNVQAKIKKLSPASKSFGFFADPISPAEWASMSTLSSATPTTSQLLAQITAMHANQDSIVASADHPEMSNDF